MRVIRWRKIGVAKLVLGIVFSILVLWLLKSKFNAESLMDESAEALIAERNITGPEWVQGLGNFELSEEPIRTGPGEGGRAHHLRPDQKGDAKRSIAEYGMNKVCSDEISLERNVPDLRHEECKHWNYPENLPKVSVIIVFHNEGFSILMRTVYSIVNRSPPQFLEEVLLVDDFSDKEDLKDKLESHIKLWGGKVRLIRNKEREGLINTKTRGAREARGEIIVFLDAHCEVMKNWLPPLVTPIHNNRTTITGPIIETIDENNFEIRRAYPLANHWRGNFEWGLEYRQNMVPARELRGRSHFTEPYRSPTHAGGLFAINRAYFFELGTYDPGLLWWGGEQFDLSFKVWLCGGSILFVPCSRVGHVTKTAYTFTSGELSTKRKGSLIIGNYRRVVETWMDEKHKEYFYRRVPSAKYNEMGDISDQLKLKEKLKCKSFQWYMEDVAYDVFIFSPAPPPNKHWGFLTNPDEQDCVVPPYHGRVPSIMEIVPCNEDNTIARLNVQGQLGIDQHCVIYVENELKYDACAIGTVDGLWEYDETNHAMFHKGEGKCMAVDREQPGHLTLLSCDPNDSHQQWLFLNINHFFQA